MAKVRWRDLLRPGPAVLLVGCALLACACRRSVTATPPSLLEAPAPDRSDRSFFAGTGQIQGEVDRLIASLPHAPPQERAASARRLLRLKEVAVPGLLRALATPDPALRRQAVWILGLIGDRRTLDSLARHLRDPDEAVRWEAATALVRGKDQRGLDLLIAGLSHADPLVRARAILVLEAETGQRLNYEAAAPLDERQAAIKRWVAWRQRLDRMTQAFPSEEAPAPAATEERQRPGERSPR